MDGMVLRAEVMRAGRFSELRLERRRARAGRREDLEAVQAQEVRRQQPDRSGAEYQRTAWLPRKWKTLALTEGLLNRLGDDRGRFEQDREVPAIGRHRHQVLGSLDEILREVAVRALNPALG